MGRHTIFSPKDTSIKCKQTAWPRQQQTSKYAWRTDLPRNLVERPPKPPRQCHPPLRHRRVPSRRRRPPLSRATGAPPDWCWLLHAPERRHAYHALLHRRTPSRATHGGSAVDCNLCKRLTGVGCVPLLNEDNHIMHYFIEERLIPACQLVREALATLRPDGQYMLEANGSLSHLG